MFSYKTARREKKFARGGPRTSYFTTRSPVEAPGPLHTPKPPLMLPLRVEEALSNWEPPKFVRLL